MGLSPAKNILVRGVNWLGDAVMTTPALARLRESYPQARITLLTPAKLRDLWQNHPALDAVESFLSTETVWSISRRLRAQKFDLGIVFPNSPRSALELFLSGVPKRVGYRRSWRNWLLTHRVAPRVEAVTMHKRSPAEIAQLIQIGIAPARPPASAHQIFEYLHLVASLGANPEPLPPNLSLPNSSLAEFCKKFSLNLNGPEIWLGLNAGAEYGPAKRWPEARFIEAAIELQRQLKCRWLVFGLKSEYETSERITGSILNAAKRVFSPAELTIAPAALNLAGATSLGELCAALKFCRMVLTNDSGPMHVAAALGTSVVVPFGSTSPELTGPGLPGNERNQLLDMRVPCSPCFLRQCPIDFRCMTQITVPEVVTACQKAFYRDCD